MITNKVGDIFESKCSVIVHQVNCQGVMGSGIAKQIRDMFPVVFSEYRELYENFTSKGENLLGVCQLVQATEWLQICNFHSQDKYLPRGICHTNYTAFRSCCRMLRKQVSPDTIIGFPYKIGCGLAGGDWNTVLEIIEQELGHLNVEIWRLPNGSK